MRIWDGHRGYKLCLVLNLITSQKFVQTLSELVQASRKQMVATYLLGYHKH